MKIRVKRRSTPEIELHTHLSLPKIFRPKWADKLNFPDDLTELTAGNISELLGKYTALWAYANQDLSEIQRKLLGLDAAEQERINEIYSNRPAINTVEKYKKEGIFSSDRKISQYRRFRKGLHMQRASTEMFLQNFQAYINALSRELTRKSTLESIGPRYSR